MARRQVKGKCVRALTLQEIAIASGLSLDRVTQISWQTDWDSISITEAERFLAGCNFDPLSAEDRNRKNAYVRASRKRNPASIFAYLKRSPLWKSQYQPRISLLKSLSTS